MLRGNERNWSSFSGRRGSRRGTKRSSKATLEGAIMIQITTITIMATHSTIMGKAGIMGPSQGWYGGYYQGYDAGQYSSSGASPHDSASSETPRTSREVRSEGMFAGLEVQTVSSVVWAARYPMA